MLGLGLPTVKSSSRFFETPFEDLDDVFIQLHGMLLICAELLIAVRENYDVLCPITRNSALIKSSDNAPRALDDKELFTDESKFPPWI